jgi:hypothetical protein
MLELGRCGELHQKATLELLNTLGGAHCPFHNEFHGCGVHIDARDLHHIAVFGHFDLSLKHTLNPNLGELLQNGVNHLGVGVIGHSAQRSLKPGAEQGPISDFDVVTLAIKPNALPLGAPKVGIVHTKEAGEVIPHHLEGGVGAPQDELTIAFSNGRGKARKQEVTLHLVPKWTRR